MANTFDRIVVGNNIRNFRKKKKMTLGELAKGICSIGKMSNIENGITAIQKKDLILIAKKLELPYTLLINNNVIEHNKILQQMEEIQVCLSFNMGLDALSQIEGIKKDFQKEIDEHPTLQLNLKYIEGQAFLITGNDFNASSIFYQMLNYTPSSNGDIILRAKAQHKLGELYEKNKQYQMANEHFKKAIDELDTNKIEVSWVVYYNLSILCMYQRQYDKASVYLLFVKRKNPRLQYLEALLHLFSENYKEGIELLKLSKGAFVESKDTEMIIRSIMATLYFAPFSPTQYTVRMEKNTVRFIENDLIRTRYEDKIQIELLIITMHSIISTNLQAENYTKVATYLDLLINFEERHNYTDFRHITLLLRAMYLKSAITKDPKIVDQILEEAQTIMEAKDLRNLHLFNIYYERSLLQDEVKSFAFKALEVFFQNSNLDTLDLIQYEHFMPKIISI
ncbi:MULTISPECIES: helix-turn-helix transcriptional regulator [unclassified Sporosarcina]|uniref:helix-turn-helix transcriptional regulator n=1 Tax=unclassified Sporosarcina TaxID=2647733 RepID=UPI001A930625|nr:MULTISPECIES: helix-turn-helix transcriptional regulator [unclassified Sporosarcina]MBO0587581.1 helix-turn-helix transcriptional regulator [Sporosarcina sp. E16_8]MBO0602431.1 helix-turn-helix transcriptional regulator [Sporosarcina sp. E16_3]